MSFLAFVPALRAEPGCSSVVSEVGESARRGHRRPTSSLVTELRVPISNGLSLWAILCGWKKMDSDYCESFTCFKQLLFLVRMLRRPLTLVGRDPALGEDSASPGRHAFSPVAPVICTWPTQCPLAVSPGCVPGLSSGSIYLLFCLRLEQLCPRAGRRPPAREHLLSRREPPYLSAHLRCTEAT